MEGFTYKVFQIRVLIVLVSLVTLFISSCSTTKKIFEVNGFDGTVYKAFKGNFSGIRYVTIKKYFNNKILYVLNFDVKVIDGEKAPWLTKTEYYDGMITNWIGVTDTTVEITFFKRRVEKERLWSPIQFNKIDSLETVVLSRALQSLDSRYIEGEQRKATNILGFLRTNIP